MKLKICGMKNPENILEVAGLNPDYMGFIFWEPSPRYFAGPMLLLPNDILKVGVFVDASLPIILSRKEEFQLDLIQLHGNESPEFCQKVRKIAPVIKVFSVDQQFDLSTIVQYEQYCDYYLFDTKGQYPGGNGEAFDWQLLSKYSSAKPFFISGGIGLEEIAEIKKLNLPIHGIDMNSKLEVSPGIKNVASCQLARVQIN